MSAVSLGAGYRRLWSVAALSNLGDGIREAALPLLAAALTGDPVLVAGVTVAQRVPWLASAAWSSSRRRNWHWG